MLCPKCGGATRVSNSATDERSVYRQRTCKKCGYIFYTTEVENSYQACRKLIQIRSLRNFQLRINKERGKEK